MLCIGIWGGWQPSHGSEHPSAIIPSAGQPPSVVNQTQTHHIQGQPQGQELSDMLQMLDQSGTSTFEELNINMFHSSFE